LQRRHLQPSQWAGRLQPGIGEYFWTDPSAQAGVGYEYHLEIMWSSGKHEWAGKVWILAAKNQIYMPLVNR
jgi:hypothetical protein